MLELLTAATATNSPPSGATAGVALRGQQPGRSRKHRWYHQPSGVLVLKSTAGSGVMTVTIKMWGYSPHTAAWHPLGSSATEADRGKLNDKNAIDEDGADVLTHAEPITGLGAFTRLYAEITAISGTSTAVTLQLLESDGH